MTSKSEQAEQRTTPVVDPILAKSHAVGIAQAEADAEPLRYTDAVLEPKHRGWLAAVESAARWDADHGRDFRTWRAELTAWAKGGTKHALAAHGLLGALDFVQHDLNNIANGAAAEQRQKTFTLKDVVVEPFPKDNPAASVRVAYERAIAAAAHLPEAWRGAEEAWRKWGEYLDTAQVSPTPVPLKEMPDSAPPRQTHARGVLSDGPEAA